MTTTTRTTTCPTCLGRRYLDIDTQRIHGGVRCGSDITLRFQCETCAGRGAVDTLDAIRDRTFADQLAHSDRAHGL